MAPAPVALAPLFRSSLGCALLLRKVSPLLLRTALALVLAMLFRPAELCAAPLVLAPSLLRPPFVRPPTLLRFVPAPLFVPAFLHTALGAHVAAMGVVALRRPVGGRLAHPIGA